MLALHSGRASMRHYTLIGLPVVIATITLLAVLFPTFAHAQEAAALLESRPAPAFALADQDGRTHHLRDYQGRPLVLLYFSELTPAMEQELCSLRDAMPQLDKASAKVFALCSLTPQAGRDLHTRLHLNFPLLSDPQGKVAQQYGALTPDHHIQHATFVVNGQGRVVLALPQDQIDVKQHGRQLLRMASCSLTPMPAALKAAIGKPVQNFTLPRVDTGSMETFLPAKRPRVTVALFLSGKCPCSQGYDARMKSLAQTYLPKGVRFVGINASADETEAEAEAHRQRSGLPFPIVKDLNNVVADQMNARITPEVFVVDAKGILRYHGRIDDDRSGEHVHEHTLQRALDALLAGSSPPRDEGGSLGCAIMRRQNATLTSFR